MSEKLLERPSRWTRSRRRRRAVTGSKSALEASTSVARALAGVLRENHRSGVAKRIVEHIVPFGVQSVGVFAYNPTAAELRLIESHNVTTQWLERVGALNVDDSLVASLLSPTRRTIVIERPDDLLPALPADHALFHPTGPGPVLVAPMIAGDRLVGAIHLGLSAANSLSPALIAAIEAITEVFAIGMDAAAYREAERAQQAPAEAGSHAAEADRARSEWVSIVAHDLRQPVSTIALYAGWLAREAPESKPARQIVEAVLRLDRMIGELLECDRIDGRRLALNRTSVDLRELMPLIAGRCERDLLGHPLEIEFHGEPALLEADPDRLEELLRNLISNAAEYSDPGAAVRMDIEAHRDRVELTVSNRGPAIPAADIPLLFTRYHRSKAMKRSRRAGLGLGLYITKGLVEAHDGTIQLVDIVPGHTSFRVAIPVRRHVLNDSPA